MLASYLLSRTLIPTMVMYIMRGHEHRALEPTNRFREVPTGLRAGFESFARAISSCWRPRCESRGLFAICFVTFCVLSLGLVFFLGQDLFPQVDAGLIASAFPRPLRIARGGDCETLR